MCKVIYVDDDEEDMFLFDKAMNEIDRYIDVYYAVCGDDLFYHLNIWLPDYLFLDLMMPGKGGLDCLKKIRNISNSIPVIIFTLSGDQQLINDCYDGRANYFVRKPRNYQKLLQLLRNIFLINWKMDGYPEKERFVIS